MLGLRIWNKVEWRLVLIPQCGRMKSNGASIGGINCRNFDAWTH